MACRTSGPGRLAPVEEIVDAVMTILNRSRDFEGRKVLVTAGPTVEDIDPVRFIGNRSSGKQGHALADEAARRGAKVVLVTTAAICTPTSASISGPASTGFGL